MAIAVICAETDGAAATLASSSELGGVWFAQGIRDRPLPSDEEALAYRFEALRVGRGAHALVGGVDRVRERVAQLVEDSAAD